MVYLKVKTQSETYFSLILNCGFIFLAFISPFQIKKILYLPEIYFSGKFPAFETVFLHIQEILIIVLLILFAFLLLKNSEKIQLNNKYIFLFFIFYFIFAEISLLFAKDKILTILNIWQFSILILLYFLLIQKAHLLSIIQNSLIISSFFQGFLAIFQYIGQKSLGLHFLGEPLIAANISNVAKINVENSLKIRSYGTFEHPNILGFFLSFTIFLNIQKIFSTKKDNQYFYFYLCALIIQIIALYLTFSRHIIFALMISLAIAFVPIWRKKIKSKIYMILSIIFIPLIIFIIFFPQFQERIFSLYNQEAFNERIDQIKTSFKIISENPMGVGYRNYTILLPNYIKNQPINPWDLQPVHNTYLLLAAELGILFILILILLIVLHINNYLKQKKIFQNLDIYYKTQIKKALFVSILILSFFDHYIITSFNAQLILIFILFYLSEKTETVKKIT